MALSINSISRISTSIRLNFRNPEQIPHNFLIRCLLCTAAVLIKNYKGDKITKERPDRHKRRSCHRDVCVQSDFFSSWKNQSSDLALPFSCCEYIYPKLHALFIGNSIVIQDSNPFSISIWTIKLRTQLKAISMRNKVQAEAQKASSNRKGAREDETMTASPGDKNSEEIPSTRCFDWMVVGGSTSYARDRETFTTYRPFKNIVIIGGGCVVGIGTVHLAVVCTHNESSTYNLVLENVCHIPDALCNGFRPSMVETKAYHHCVEGHMQGLDAIKRPIWHAKFFCGSYRLVLSGDPKGVSPIRDLHQKNVRLNLSMFTSKKEIDDIKANLEEEPKEESDKKLGILSAQL